MTPYEKCSDGPFYPFHDHETLFGWGVRVKDGGVFAYVGAKGCAFGLAVALNGHWDAARVFIDGDRPGLTPEYLRRFVS